MGVEEIDIFERFDSLLKDCPNHVMLSEGSAETEITAAQLDILSGKVYRYLKDKGFGKEDMICILLPRGTAVAVALLGIWKAGAAAVIIEENDPVERIEYIQKDCGCVLVLNEQVWKEILSVEPLEGHEPIDPHAAAFAVYTSGTSGNPKGVLHEYGRIPITFASYRWNGISISQRSDIIILYFPLNFVASIMFMIISWMIGTKLLIAPCSVSKDPLKIMEFLIENKVTLAFFPPSLFRIQKDFGPYLKKVILSSEPAHGIWKEPSEMMVFNGYCSSETACGLLVSVLDKPNVTAPVGLPQYNVGVYLVDDEDSPVEKGEAGELCFDAPFTRGYINLPEQTARTFKNGIFHSGDLARQMSDGQYQIIGRISDTIKINGKRVEPTEVEEAIKRVTGLEWTAVRSIKDKNGMHLAAYHLGEAEIGITELREKLGQILPYYMLPSYFVKIDSIPRLHNGKMNRKALPRPAVSDYLREYAPPTNETEEIICNAMQKVLKIKKVGIKDDFFLLGGDSLTSMKLIVETGLSGLTFEDIYLGCTVSGIAEQYLSKMRVTEGSTEKINAQAIKKSHPLTVEQKYILNYEFYTPNTTMYNNPALCRFIDVTAEDLAAAINKTIQNHPSLLTTIYYENGEYKQRYAPEMMHEITVEKVSDEELETLRVTLVQPFRKVTDSLLWRSRVFSAPSGNYIFFDVHHLIFDGTSYWLFMSNLQKCLSGMGLEPDYYYYVLEQREKEMNSALYEEAKSYFEKRYAGQKCIRNLPYDYTSDENFAGDIDIPLQFTNDDYNAFEASTGIGRNGLFLIAGLLALSSITNSDKVMITWIYNGRKDLDSMNSIGMLFYTLPLMLTVTENLTMEEMLTDIKEQMNNALKYSSCSFVSSTYVSPVKDDSICFMLQDDARSLSENWQYPFEMVDIAINDRASQTSLDVEIMTNGDEPNLYLDYAASLYKSDTIKHYGALTRSIADKLIYYRDFPDIHVKELIKNIEREGTARINE
ncbi:Acyl-CoA synthetase (AMP-forming)/AMP-acid ligase II [Lachnospiraceae bacterium]|nr:Acyl-CoA synthetase (AMP-forming)/AMP-acid ligase II [Lachnospiraceae bacterium]